MSDNKRISKLMLEYIKFRDQNYKDLFELIYKSMAFNYDEFMVFLHDEEMTFTIEWFKQNYKYIISDNSIMRLFNINKVVFSHLTRDERGY